MSIGGLNDRLIIDASCTVETIWLWFRYTSMHASNFPGRTDAVVRTLVVGVLIHVVLVSAMPATGKRTMPQHHAVGLIFTVSPGLMSATVLLSDDILVADGIAALLMLNRQHG